ncbi:hypothetical protein GDO78_010168, partial [Eleutherodactylus coqui]
QQPKNDVPIVQKSETGRRKAASAPTRGRKPETIRIITSDLIRDLVVPSEDPSGLSLIMTYQDFSRIKGSARLLTKEEQEKKMQALKEEKEAAIEAASERKNFMKQKEMLRKKNEKLSDLEEEAQQRAQYLLQRANTMRMEKEDEIKKLNEIILNAKCHAIRDAQILERSLVSKELAQEEKRLDQMMEVERKKAIKRQEEIEERRKQEKIRGKLHIIKQMEDNEQSRILEEEQRDQEAQKMLQFLEELQMEDYKDMERKKQEQLEIQEEIKRVNVENERKKKERKDQERLADLRVLEYTKQKLDALRAKRSQEAMERAWRQKEKEESLKQEEMSSMLKKTRLEQVAQKEHFLAVQAQRERAEFDRVLRVQRELMEKERKEQEDKAKDLVKHAGELRRQVRENEQKQVLERFTHFEEGKKLDEEARQRRVRLDELKQKKLEELRMAGLPDKYCSLVTRKADTHLTAVH